MNMSPEIKNSIRVVYSNEYRKKARVENPRAAFWASEAGQAVSFIAGVGAAAGIIAMATTVVATIGTGILPLMGLTVLTAGTAVGLSVVPVRLAQNKISESANELLAQDTENGTLVRRYAEEIMPKRFSYISRDLSCAMEDHDATVSDILDDEKALKKTQAELTSLISAFDAASGKKPPSVPAVAPADNTAPPAPVRGVKP